MRSDRLIYTLSGKPTVNMLAEERKHAFSVHVEYIVDVGPVVTKSEADKER